MKIKGQVWKFGDNVDTDAIIAARYLTGTDPVELGGHLMEDVRPGFAGIIKPGDIILAGENFGCGSSREHAPLAIKGAGLAAVVAVNFARIFYRNAFNMGLPIFECAAAAGELEEGDRIEIDAGSGRIVRSRDGRTYQAQPVPPFMQELIRAGGLINYIVSRRDRRGDREKR